MEQNTKKYRYKASFEKGENGMTIHFKANSDSDAEQVLVGTVGFWQAQKKFHVTKKDWTITRED